MAATPTATRWPEEFAERVQGQIMVVGVGNDLRGDDGVGPAIARALADRVDTADRSRVIDCGDVPENYVGPILAAEADTIVLCDAADFGGEPGEVRILELSGPSTQAISTHNASLGLLAKVLRASAPVDVVLLGIQPVGTQFGASLSELVKLSAADVTDALSDLLRQGMW